MFDTDFDSGMLDSVKLKRIVRNAIDSSLRIRYKRIEQYRPNNSDEEITLSWDLKRYQYGHFHGTPNTCSDPNCNYYIIRESSLPVRSVMIAFMVKGFKF